MTSSGIDAGQVSVKLFEEDHMVFAKLKNGEWVDAGRGKLRAWKKGTVSWLSFISMGTKRELLMCHTFGSETIDNRIIFATTSDADSKPTSETECQLDPLPFEEGLLIHSSSKTFLFRSLGASTHEAEETGPSSLNDSDVEAQDSEDEDAKNVSPKEKRILMLIRMLKQHLPAAACKTRPNRDQLQSFDENT